MSGKSPSSHGPTLRIWRAAVIFHPFSQAVQVCHFIQRRWSRQSNPFLIRSRSDWSNLASMAWNRARRCELTRNFRTLSFTRARLLICRSPANIP